MELPQWFPVYEVGLCLIGVLFYAFFRLSWDIGWELVKWLEKNG